MPGRGHFWHLAQEGSARVARLTDLVQFPTLPLVALVGAGGKTTTMYTLARELAERGRRVITTTTTNIYIPQPGETETLVVAAETPRLLKLVQAGWLHYRHITVAGSVTGSGKLSGVRPEQPALLQQHGGAEAVLVEADGARHLQIKAPATHEPVIPLHTNLALLLLSARSLNSPLSGTLAHRPELIARVTGIEQGELLTPTVVARLLLSEQGGLKNVPESASVHVLITHATAEQRPAVNELAGLLRATTRVTGTYCSERPGAWEPAL